MAMRPSTCRNISLLFRHHGQRCYSSSISSVNSTEVSHFDKLASSWWDPHGSSGLLHQMNPLRHQFIASCLESQTDADTIEKRRYLDIGCGGGIFAESAARLHGTASVVGIDPSKEVISIARQHARQDPSLMESGKLEYRNHSIESMSPSEMPDETFDIVTLFEVIEHITRPAPFLTSCLPFVKPGGWLILSTIARTWTSWLTTKVVAENVIGLVPKDTHDWSKYVNEQELADFFRKQEGWSTESSMRKQGCIYVPGLGWNFVTGGERWGNYFFGVRRDPM